jgi:hypothetical protein
MMNAQAQTQAQAQRGSYGEIPIYHLDTETRKRISALVEGAASAAKVDEHGNWDFGIERLNRRGTRWQALNWDLYAYGTDVHSGVLLAVIQVRQAVSGRRWTQVRKNYYLIGTNEDGTTFAHPVSAHVIHAAIRAGQDVVRRVQDWIFGGDYGRMLRQGDLGLIPLRRAQGERTPHRSMVLEDSHELQASAIRLGGDGVVYAKDPLLVHLPGTHPRVEASGWHKIVVGRRAPFWKFAAPTVD